MFPGHLSSRFKGHNASALLHGKLKNNQKEKIMDDFSNGKATAVIVSTTVIEVGINVPNATVMCVLNAERFGLAQLHQLRGRVGSGSPYQSYCFLVSDRCRTRYERLSILKAYKMTAFEIAKKDMELRGTGDLFRDAAARTGTVCRRQYSIRRKNARSYAKKVLGETER